MRAVIRSVVDLCELQVQLLAIESSVAKRALARTAVFAAISIVIMTATLVVALAGAGVLVGEFTELTMGGGLMVAAGGGLLVALLCVSIAITAVKSVSASLASTKNEFKENWKWLKASLADTSHPDDAPPLRTAERSDSGRYVVRK